MGADYEPEALRRAHVERMIMEFRDAQTRRGARVRRQHDHDAASDERASDRSRQVASPFRFILRDAPTD